MKKESLTKKRRAFVKKLPQGGAGTMTERLQGLSFARMLPNLATVMAMCVGMSAIRFALLGQFQMAAAAILIAGVLDAMDGRLARLLGASSEFGAELDSLSDFVSFGVAPPVVLYILSLQMWQGVGWVPCLFFAVCMGLRLARFNISSRDPHRPLWAGRFFTGVPAPAGAMIALFPLMLTLSFDMPVLTHPFVCSVFLLLAGGLMVSRLPTFSFKTVSIPRSFLFPLLILFGMAVVSLFSAPWETLSFLIFAYLCTIPLGLRSFKKMMGKQEEKKLKGDENDGQYSEKD